MQDRATRMFLLKIDSKTTTHNRVLPAQRTPGKSKTWTPIVLVTKSERATALCLTGVGCKDRLIRRQIESRPVVSHFFPRLEIVVANSQIDSQIGGDLVIILDIAC